MKFEKLLHTPDGVRDIYGPEGVAYRELEERLRKTFLSYGYSDIRTPSFEFFDVYSSERGSVPSRDLYKFFDHDGNTLVLRPDMTPAIARCAAKYYGDIDWPVRLSYLANTYINYSGYTGRLRERSQAGAECIGYSGADADAELIALMISALDSCGLKDFRVELGQVNYFRGIAAEAGIDQDTASELKSLINGKNFYGLEDYAAEAGLSSEVTRTFMGFSGLFGGRSCIPRARELTADATALAALDHLEAIYGLLAAYGVEDRVIFDLGMFGSYDYYTGVVFRAFAYGSGEPVAAGGRYDRLMKQFGKDSPAIGFTLTLDSLMRALQKQGSVPAGVDRGTLLVFGDDAAHESHITAIDLAQRLRGEGRSVQLLRRERDMSPEACMEYAARAGFSRVISIEGQKTEELAL